MEWLLTTASYRTLTVQSKFDNSRSLGSTHQGAKYPKARFIDWVATATLPAAKSDSKSRLGKLSDNRYSCLLMFIGCIVNKSNVTTAILLVVSFLVFHFSAKISPGSRQIHNNIVFKLLTYICKLSSRHGH